MRSKFALAILTSILIAALVLGLSLVKLAFWIAVLGFCVGFIAGVVGCSGPATERLKMSALIGLALAILLPLSISLAVPLGVIALALIAFAALWRRLGGG